MILGDYGDGTGHVKWEMDQEFQMEGDDRLLLDALG